MSPVIYNSRSGRTSNGFSLVELMVVVMVILVIAAIAIPSFVHARMKANEASAVSSLNAIRTAEFMYSEVYPEEGFAPTLVALGPNSTDCTHPSKNGACLLMDEELASGVKNGYLFELTADGTRPSTNFNVTGTPQAGGLSGRCSFSGGAAADVSVVPNSGEISRFQMAGSGGCGP
ncbi:MAG TPA: prepilin-type N-terminal cleavage/methylation domain-containing protein [Candidatus Angelobacter sp.]|jgi:prepilin-type N-terminal cleavage/methylation domain-containing protein|nr:prepilin-type N-terminal cleavage/methylation domain-containing protein [Candidatus Angelobacter sp.]